MNKSGRARNGRVWALAALLPLLGVAAGCGQAGSQPQPGQPQTLTVLAAASLTESFNKLAQEFQDQHPGVQVKLDYQGSSTLAEQIKQGRQADVFASANTKNMKKVADPQLVQPPQTFAHNHLEIAVPPGNPAGIHSLADLARPETSTVVCAEQVPCGSAAKKVEDASGVQLKPASEETDVKSVLHKVAAGEADAGLVYVSDVHSAQGKGPGNAVQGIPFPESSSAVNTYPIATVADSQHQQLANEFVKLVRSPDGKKALNSAGFDTP